MRLFPFLRPQLSTITESATNERAGHEDRSSQLGENATANHQRNTVVLGGALSGATVRSHSASDLCLESHKLIIPRKSCESLPPSNRGLASHKSSALGTMQLILGSCELPPAEQTGENIHVLYEERPLCHLIGVTEPTIVITSKPVDPTVIGYYLGLRGAKGEELKALIQKTCVLNATDDTAHHLSLKVMGNDKLLGVLHSLTDTKAVKVICHSGSENIDSLTRLRDGYYHEECDSKLLHLGTKTGNRFIFEKAGAQYPAGVPHSTEDKDLSDAQGFLMTQEALIEALARQIDRAGFVKEWIVKLNEGVAGRGNAHLTLGDDLAARTGAELKTALKAELINNLKPFDKTLSAAEFLAKIPQTGVIAEVFVTGELPASPSYQGFITAQGDIQTVSTHDQVLDGQTYKGCKYPADSRFCEAMIAAGEKIGATMAAAGARGHFGVDFLASEEAQNTIDLHAIEINLRNTGTSYPFTTVTRLTEGQQAPDGDGILTQKGNKRYYSASDYVITEKLKGMPPADLIAAVKKTDIHWNPETETGVVFHLFGLLESSGRIGATAIAPDRATADELLARTQRELEKIANDRSAAVSPERWV